jgi:NAD+ kinase
MSFFCSNFAADLVKQGSKMTIAVFGNAMKSQTLAEVRRILEFMTQEGVHVLLSQELRQELDLREYPGFPENWDSDRQPENVYGEPIDFALSVGGDGTFLTSAAAIGNKNIPILGVNCGHLGFLADVQTQDLNDILQKLVEGEYTIEQRSLLTVTVFDKDGLLRTDLVMAPNALNEIAILKQGLTNMLSIETTVNGELLHTYHSDGLVISTPTGSTAYNLSIGGPLMVPQNRGIILTPIAPHSLTVKPIVVPDDWKFDLRVSSRYDTYMVSVDGRSQSLGTEMRLHVEKAPYTIKVVQIGDNSFLKSLRTKLNWGK